MKELPKYALLSNSDIPGLKVMQLERPYVIASVHDYHRDDERVSDRIEDMAQERYPVAKVKGYSVFLTVYTSLEPCSDAGLQLALLNEMAEYFYEEKISRKPGQFMKSEESGRDERRILKRGTILRERKSRKRDE